MKKSSFLSLGMYTISLCCPSCVQQHANIFQEPGSKIIRGGIDNCRVISASSGSLGILPADSNSLNNDPLNKRYTKTQTIKVGIPCDDYMEETVKFTQPVFTEYGEITNGQQGRLYGTNLTGSFFSGAGQNSSFRFVPYSAINR